MRRDHQNARSSHLSPARPTRQDHAHDRRVNVVPASDRTREWVGRAVAPGRQSRCYALAAPARPRGEAACTIIISPMVSDVT